ncbi:MAG: RNA methyltransferase [Methanomicrobiales archaeon HGW-Methanomicrobiales-1]|jgi:tRNA (guanine10-N2)-dimethyltransferase|nr:MAG: RNA methyltransferase [Methanomicrobiales archaeon HGW-Methanomicrobiales-1]
MKLLFELSGENPTLPFAELSCVGTILEERLQVAVVDCPHPEQAQRLAMTQVVLEYLGECEPNIPAFKNLLKELAITTTRTFAGRAKKVHGGLYELNPSSQREFERCIGDMIAGPVSLNNPETEYRAILSEDKCYFGRVLFSINRSGYDERNPGKRDFFHPGVMMPRMARTLANIAGVQAGDRVLDPFCGTGGILIEAELLGAHAIGSDFDPLMISGSRQNCSQSFLMLADATRLPFKDHSIDSVVTDLPYGQSVCIKKADTMDNLYAGALDEIRRVLKPGRRAVVVTHKDISVIARQHMTVLQQHEQRVHKSLTRRVLVLGH